MNSMMGLFKGLFYFAIGLGALLLIAIMFAPSVDAHELVRVDPLDKTLPVDSPEDHDPYALSLMRGDSIGIYVNILPNRGNMDCEAWNWTLGYMRQHILTQLEADPEGVEEFTVALKLIDEATCDE